MFVCMGFWLQFSRNAEPRSLLSRVLLARSLYIVMVLLFFTPILRTLTEDISSDTIWALTCGLFTVNALWHPYIADTTVLQGVAQAVPLNAAIFASVLLASRLSLNQGAFCIVFLAVILFAVFPVFSHCLQVFAPKLVNLSVTGLLILTVYNLLASGRPAGLCLLRPGFEPLVSVSLVDFEAAVLQDCVVYFINR